MNKHTWRVIAVAVVLSAALASPSLAGGAKERAPFKGPGGPATQLAPNPCPSGWTLLPGGTKDNFFCAPPKVKINCPPDTKQVERNCAVGCEPKSN